MIKIKSLLNVFILSLSLSGITYSHVVLIYPIAGEIFQAGEIVTIEWHVAISHGPADWDLFFSDDGGINWETIALNLPQNQLTYDWTVPNLATDSGKVRVVQDNLTGIDYTATCGNFTINATTEINEIGTGSDDFKLLSAYPNPFNPVTTIGFTIPKTINVNLTIFNILGEEVVTLHSGSLYSGSHTYQWDASQYAGGVYFYRLEAGEYVETRKIVLLK